MKHHFRRLIKEARRLMINPDSEKIDKLFEDCERCGFILPSEIYFHKSEIPCEFYGRGYCKFGNNCPYQHGTSTSPPKRSPKHSKPKNNLFQACPYCQGFGHLKEPCHNFLEPQSNPSQKTIFFKYVHTVKDLVI